jgi:PKD repeat protein
MKIKKLISVKLIVIFSLFSLSTNIAFSQNVVRCFTDEMDSILKINNPDIESKQAFENWLGNEMQTNTAAKIIGGVYYIPVVVHVIHNGETVGSGTNVSFAAIQSQIDVLNEDFRRMLGSNGWNTNAAGADTKIEFCLAQRRPDGSAFAAGEPGVNRINRTTAGFSTPPFSTTYIDATIKPWTYNNNTPTATRGWDPAKYMNIWLCNISGGILGYAQFPQSPIGGMGCGTPVASTDGVVFLYNSIGKSAVTGFAGPYNEGRTATHEIGHWLGLRHIWGDGGCTVDDYCNDTPEAAAANYGCPTGTNSCTGAPDAGVDMIENYMDYTDDLCMNIFTEDQKMRMRTVLESSPLRVSLINSDACTPPIASDAAVIDVINPKGDNCAGSITPTVVLKNRGSSNLTSATISYSIDNGSVTTFNWTGSLTPNATANVNLTAFTSPLGTHFFKTWSTLPNGAADQAVVYDTSGISFVISNGEMAPFVANFDGSVFPPDVRWQLTNGGSDCYYWVGASGVSSTGVFANNIAQVPMFGNSTAQTESLITPIFILPCNATAANIEFDVAYRRRTSSTNEQLFVDISTDCGATWNSTPIFNKSGATLATSTTLATTSWYPTAATHWRNETISLLSFVTGTSSNVKFRFRAIAANGNNLYIDNFKFNATTPGEINVTQNANTVLDGGSYNFGSVSPGSSSTATFTITNSGTSNLVLTAPITVTGTGFTLGSTFGTTTVAAGATTTFTVAFSPTAGGTFTGNVSFATNDCDESTYNFTLNGTSVSSPPVANFSATPLSSCAGTPVTFTDLSTNTTSWSWNFGAGATPTTSTLQNPTVTFNTAGVYSITLIATNSSGSDTQTNTNYITALGTTATALPINQGFTATTFVPANWTLVNANNSPTTWVRSATIGNTPTTGNSMMFDNNNYADADDDQVRMPSAIFTGLVSAQLQFDVAYAQYNATYFDGLDVSVSIDCGQTFTSVYSKSGTTLATAPNTTANFSPTTTQWRTETVDLTNYVGNPAVIVAFTNLSGNGNRLFVDNINLTGVVSTTPPVASYTSSATAACAGTAINFTNTSTGTPTSYNWTFTGGTPATSTAANPTVTYSTPGVYSVSLDATNASGTNTVTQTNSITINGTTAAPGTISGTTTLCSGTAGNVYSITAVSGATSYTWTAPAGSTIVSGQGTNSVTIAFGSTSGNVSVVANNACGASAPSDKSITITQTPSAPTLSVVNNCGNSVISTVSTANLLWSNGLTTSSITVTTAGTYTATQSLNGCTSPVSTIQASPNTIPSAPVVTVSNLCGSSILTSTTTGTLNWSNNATTTSITVTNSGNYDVYQTVNGCLSTTATATAAPLIVPNVALNELTSVCVNSPKFTLTGGSPTGGTYSGTGVVSNQFDPSIAGLGTFTITYTFTDVNGCSAQAQQSITVGCASIEDLNKNNFTIYPNPNDGTFTISGIKNPVQSVKVFDMSGKLVKEMKIENNQNQVNVNIQHCAEGIYSVEISSNKSISRVRIVKTK